MKGFFKMIKRICRLFSGFPMTAVSAAFLAGSLILMIRGVHTPYDPALVTILISGFPLVCEAFEELFREHKISSALLVTIAMAACVSLSENFAAGEVAFIMTLGEFLEDRTIRRAQKGLQKLISLAPSTCRLVRDGTESRIGIETVVPGDILRILPGETIPVDGAVVRGETSVDQSSMTGESLPADKGIGDLVVSGSVNCFGTVDIRALKTGENSSLQKLIRMVKEAAGRKAPTQKIVDRWAAYLVPAALLLAAVTYFITWDLIRAVTILVVFCPCSLVLATPTAIMAAIGQAARHGVLVKSGEALEAMGRIDVIAFDKTGTITSGRLAVSDIVPADGRFSREDVLSTAASAELRSEHPLGKAIAACARKEKVRLSEPEGFHASSGKGIGVRIRGSQVFCGSEHFMGEQKISLPEGLRKRAEELGGEGKALVFVAKDGEMTGVLALSDTLRESAAQIVGKLHSLNVETVLLTGDHAQNAAYFAERAGIRSVHAELLPGEKAGCIAELQKAGHKVCMIGDGINDAPALKTASVGAAMASLGSDIAVEAADIALTTDDLSRIPYLKQLSNAVIQSIKVNISLGMGINFVAIVLAILGFMGPISGALVHNAGSILVILNAALLYDRKIE